MARLRRHTEAWGEFVDVKINAPVLLSREVADPGLGVDRVLLGTTTDAYQPAEASYGLTRRLLEELAAADIAVSVLTKSDLVCRDLDVLQRSQRAEMGISLATLDDNVRRWLEPHASSVADRVAALKMAHDRGVRTFAFIGPIVPGITRIGETLEAVAPYTDTVWGETLRTHGEAWTSLARAAGVHSPDLSDCIRAAVADQAPWEAAVEEFQRTCRALGLAVAGVMTYPARRQGGSCAGHSLSGR
jgi:DNA repair photolyase